jgi:hypothetical protein
METAFAAFQGVIDEKSAAYKSGQSSAYIFAAIVIIVVLLWIRSKK